MMRNQQETVRELRHQGDCESAGWRCEDGVTARTRCGWVKIMECGELPHGEESHLKLKWTADESHAR